MPGTPDGGERGGVATPKERRHVTIGMPRSLSDLQKVANQNFGHKGCLKLLHNGSVHVKSSGHFENIKHGDVLTIKSKAREGAKCPLSTKQAHFVQHRLEERPPKEAYASPPPPQPFVDNSSHRLDFVRHNLEKRQKPDVPGVRPGGTWRTEEFTATSTYGSSFTPKDLSVRTGPVNRAPPEDKNLPPGKVYLESTQRADFTKHDFKVAATSPSSFNKQKPWPVFKGRKFDSKSTYQDHFLKFTAAKGRPASSGGPASYDYKSVPFYGQSSYREQFVQHPLGQQKALTLVFED